jgi:hypothetical protein
MKGVTVSAHACLQAWINCESLLTELSIRTVSYAHRLELTVDECAQVCMDTWQALKTKPNDTQKLLQLCIRTCEECAALCSRYEDDWFRQCARACRACADKLSELSFRNRTFQ